MKKEKQTVEYEAEKIAMSVSRVDYDDYGHIYKDHDSKRVFEYDPMQKKYTVVKGEK